jgi:O-antigen ligase
MLKRNKIAILIWIINFLFITLIIPFLLLTGRQRMMIFIIASLLILLIWKIFGIAYVFAVVAIFVWIETQPPFIPNLIPIFSSITIIEFSIYVVAFILLIVVLGQKKLESLLLNKSLPGKYIYLLFLFCGLIAVIIGESGDNLFSWSMWFQVIIAPLALWFLLSYCIRTAQQRNIVIWGLILGGLFLSFFILTGKGFIGWASSSAYEERLSGLYDLGFFGILWLGSNMVSVYFGMIIILVWSRLLIKARPLPTILYFLIISVMAYVIYRLQTRTVWIALPVVLLVVYLLNFMILRSSKFSRLVIIIPVLLILFFLIGTMIVSFSPLSKNFQERNIVFSSYADFANDPNFVWRTHVWQNAWEILKVSPLGTGYPSDLILPVHNQYLAIALATGIEGLFIFLVFIYLWLRRLLKALKLQYLPLDAWILPAGIGCGVFFLIISFTIDPTKDFYTYISFWIILSISLISANDPIIKEMKNDT